jgi:hypothetical protein
MEGITTRPAMKGTVLDLTGYFREKRKCESRAIVRKMENFYEKERKKIN